MPDEKPAFSLGASFSPDSPAREAFEAPASEGALSDCPSLSLSGKEGRPRTVFLDVPGDVRKQIFADAFEQSDARPDDPRPDNARSDAAVQARLRPLVSGYVEPGQPFVDRHTLRRLLESEQESQQLSVGSDLTLTRHQVAVGILVFGALLLFLVVYGMFAG